MLGSPALAAEYLGLSRKEAELVSGTDLTELWVQWGFEGEIQADGATWLDKIEPIDEMLRRSGLEYRELLDLLQMQYVDSGHSLSIVSTDADHPDTCDTSKLELHGLNADFAGRIIRFVRLWRKLGWTMFDLDRAIRALGGDLSAGFLVQLSHLKRLYKRFNLPVGRLSTFWAPLDTRRYTNHDDAGKPVVPSLYDQLFRSRSSVHPFDPAFPEDPDLLTGNLIDHAEAVAAALAVGAADLYVMLQNTAVFTQGIGTALTVGNLSLLYRHFTLAKALKFRVDDYHRALALYNHDPFADALHTFLFVELVTQTKHAGLSFADLDYLLRHQSEASTRMAIKDSAVADRLQDIWRDAQEGTTNEIVQRILEQRFGLAEGAVPSLEPQWTSLTEAGLADTNKKINRDIFPTQFDMLGRLSTAANGTALGDEAIAVLLLDIRQALQKAIAAKEAIARKLAEAYGFEMRTVKLLEPQWISMAERALADVTKAFTRSNFGMQFDDLVRLEKISKIVTHFHLDAGMLEWLLSQGAVQGLFDLTSLPTTPSATNFPKWHRLVNLLALRDVMRQGETGLLELLEFAHQTVAPDEAQVLATLVELVNWNHTDLQYLVGANGFDLTLPNDFENEKALLQLRDCFAVLKRLGISAEHAKKLSAADVTLSAAQGVKQAVRSKYDDAQWFNIAKPLRDVLREKQRAALVAYLVIRIKVPFTQLETPHPQLSLNDKRPAVRELQQKLNAAGANPPLTVDGEFSQATQDAVVKFQNRNGIADHSGVEISTWSALDAVRRNLRDTKDLYAHFLIDVEMDPCMMTSRIKQAISSVQLFVQRCLMNLEPNVLADSETDDAWNWWKWMKNYRIWEANRKVFLYPENWVEPELRDDKSQFFKELESELLESDLTLETAEAAFLNYVEKLDQVARLEMMSVYHQKDSEIDILHVFARTQTTPRLYYYRQRVNAAYWTPWEKVDLDIEGDHLIPVLWNSRLFLFWPMFMEKAASSRITIPPLGNGGDVKDQTMKYWDMKLAWSERKQGKWISKKISSRTAQIFQSDGQLADLSKVFFLVSAGTDLAIDQAFVTTKVARKAIARSTMERPANPTTNSTGGIHIDPDDLSDPVFDYGSSPSTDAYIVGSQNLFFFKGCYFDPQIFPHGYSAIGSGQNVLMGTVRSFMSFQEKPEAALNLPARRDLVNSQAALAQTPGRYTVTSQGADSGITRNPFLFQDPSRSYLIVPKLSWWDDIVVDPSEIGGALVERRALTFTSPTDSHDATGAGIASIVDLSGTLEPGLVSDSGLAASPAIALGPDPLVIAPFVHRPNTKYSFHPLYHPYVCALTSILNRQGLDQMLRREVQLEPHRFLPGGASITPFSFESVYAPSTDLVAQPYPTEEMDFSFSGAYSSYNWELFFHAPLLIADRLAKNQRFEEAANWFHYIFNPTDSSGEPSPQRYWQTKEFFEKTSEDFQLNRLDNLFKLLARANELRQKLNPTPAEQKDLQRLNSLEASIKAWRKQPFKPHLVARMRTTAYQKAVVMKYIDNLIAWGDQLFRRDTLETINEATQLYVLAADILGPRPVEAPPRLTPRVQTYNSLEPRLDDFSNALVEIEELFSVNADPGPNIPEQQPPTMLYFCLPKNDKLLRYWDTVADRLFKIRHCMNIKGVVRQLPLFEPPIDPALLVRGIAAGVDMNSLINDVDPSLPGYRFNVLSQKATELSGELRSLGATLLATLEKRDAEELSLLRAKHETGMLEMIEQVREKQLEEANASRIALQNSRELVVSRYLHYQALLGVESPQIPAADQVIPEITPSPLAKISVSDGIKQISHETAEMTLPIKSATSARGKAAAASLIATHFAPIPDVMAQPMGVGGALVLHRLPTELAQMFGAEAEDSTYRAGRSSRYAQYVMRAHEWTLQNNIAAREIMQIDKQIIAAEIRSEIARHELRNHRRQMENALEVEAFMRDKYTNQELYSWMVGQVSGVYFQSLPAGIRSGQTRGAMLPLRASACRTAATSVSATGTV